MNIEYKKLQGKDSKAYRKIRLECLQKSPERFGSIFEEECKKEKLSFEIYIEENSESHFIIGAFHTSELIGICGFYPKSENPEKGEIIQMFVKSSFQGNGIGLQLLQFTLKKVFDSNIIQSITLGLFSQNIDDDPLIAFYKKAGFDIYEIVENDLVRNHQSFTLVNMILGKP